MHSNISKRDNCNKKIERGNATGGRRCGCREGVPVWTPQRCASLRSPSPNSTGRCQAQESRGLFHDSREERPAKPPPGWGMVRSERWSPGAREPRGPLSSRPRTWPLPSITVCHSGNGALKDAFERGNVLGTAGERRSFS